MSESRRQLLSIGVFCIVLVVAILLLAVGAIGDWLNIFPVVFLLFGIWLIALAGMSAQNPQKYERDPFSTAGMGIALMTIGGAWLLFRTSVLYSIALIVLVIGAVAIAAALKRKKP
jgi:phosphoglycerol transferase MdoB-like AlkP superfamily enzyme